MTPTAAPRSSQLLGDGPADPARAAGDDGDAAGQVQLVNGGTARRRRLFGQGTGEYTSRGSALDAEHDAEQRASARETVDEDDRSGRVDRFAWPSRREPSTRSGVLETGDRRHAAGGHTETPPRTPGAPETPDSPSAPLIEVITVRDPPKSEVSACASQRIELARRVRRGIDDVDVRGRESRHPRSPASSSARALRDGPATRSARTAALDAATPRISPWPRRRTRRPAARARSRRAPSPSTKPVTRRRRMAQGATKMRASATSRRIGRAL